MDKQVWDQVNEIVDHALDLDKDKRLPFIQKECGDKKELQQRTIKLLKAIEQSKNEKFLEEPSSLANQIAREVLEQKQQAQTSSLLGQTIDKYELQALIGHGGMGSVFLAKRADDAYDQRVALKIMRIGMETPSNVARFKRERNILAKLNHPNIAQLHDGGMTTEGLPYLVMEYIEGTPLIEYCNTHNLSIEKRLDLFETVCEAVRHAHQNAIIHRDLKPSNILVSDDGTVKVLDFGIAKFKDPPKSEAASFQTRTGSRILTLGYSAPEQIESNPITTAVDTYTLGILLYELLSGVHPYDLEDKSLTKIEKMIRHQSPALPSQKYSQLPESEKNDIAVQRNTSAINLRQHIKGDLDAIVMKALRKEPEARYDSVEQMFEDLNRYYQSRPLIAQSDTLRYKAGKFFKRNRNSVVGTLLILIAVIGFGSYHVNQITQERNIAEREAQKAQTVKAFLLDIFRSSNPQSARFEGSDLTAKELLTNGKNAISQSLKDQPDINIEITLAIGDAFASIDEFEKAEQSYRQALAKSEQSNNPISNKVRTYVKLGNLKSKWNKDNSTLKPAREAEKLLKKLNNPTPDLQASVAGLLGRANVFSENYEQANVYYKKADSLYSAAGVTNSFDRAQMLNGYGKLLIYNSDPAKAEEMLLKSNELHQKAALNPTMTVVNNYKFLGWAHRDMGNFEESNNYFKKAIQLAEQLNGEENMPKALSMYHLSINYMLIGNYKKAETTAKEVLKTYKKLLDPSNDHLQRPKKYIAIAQYNQNELSEAQQLLQDIIDKRIKYRRKGNIGLAAPYSHLAVTYQKQGNHEKALSLLEKSITIYKKELGDSNNRIARAMIKKASVYRDMGEYEMAKQYFKKVKDIQRDVLPDNHREKADFHFEYAKLKLDIDEPGQAQQHFQKAYTIYRENFGEDSNPAKKVKSYLEKLAQA